MARRSDDDRLRLLCRIVERIPNEPAWGQPFRIQIRMSDGVWTTTTEEAPRSEMRSLLMEVRKLDQPGEDAYLPDMFELVARRVSEDADRRSISRIRAVYDRLQKTDDIRLEDSQGEISARTAFELWAYGEHLHDDEAKAARLAALPVEMGAFARQNAVRYMQKLVRMAAFLRAVILEDTELAAVARDLPTP
jgi:hypothetical protein